MKTIQKYFCFIILYHNGKYFSNILYEFLMNVNHYLNLKAGEFIKCFDNIVKR